MTGSDLHIETDVLVVGGGLAGCWAAIRARDFVPRVTLLEKAQVARSGASVFTNSMLAPTADEELEQSTKELVEAGEFLNDQNWVRILLQEQHQRIADLVKWGVPFERTADGQLATTPGRGHKRTRLIMCNGHRLMDLMKAKALEKGVQIQPRTMALELLTSDGQLPTRGRVIGVVGVDTRSGQLVVCHARAVIITTGILDCKLRAEYINNCTGDGPAMAFHAGAQLLGMEFCTQSRMNAFNDKYRFGGSSLLQGLGARFINRVGEEFIGLYDPELKNRSKLAWICQAIAKECFEGRGPVYFDMRSFTQEQLQLATRLLPSQMKSFERLGIDLTREPIKITPVVSISSTSGQGGVRIDTSCHSTLPGLYAAGSAAKNLVHGTYSTGGINLAHCNVSGYRAGENAGRAAAEEKSLPPHSAQVETLRKRILAPLTARGRPADEVTHELHKAVLTAGVCLFKNKPRLNAALQAVRRLAGEPVAAADAHELVKAHEVGNVLLMAGLCLEASLLREESRDDHYREDYPYRDDRDWLKWIVASRLPDGKTKVAAIPVPIENYPIKPAGTRTPHPVQYTMKAGS